MIDKILNSIEKELQKNNKAFFSYAWRENIINFIECESKYEALLKWINSTIYTQTIGINVFNPADKTDTYTNEYFKNYMESLKNFAFLVNMRDILCDQRTTTQMRDNIEYTICKVYNIHYNKELNEYC